MEKSKNGKYFFRYVENPETRVLEKRRSKPLTAYEKREGIAFSFPLNREPVRGKPRSRTETLELKLPNMAASDLEGMKREYLALSHISSSSVFGFYAKVFCIGFNYFDNAPKAKAFEQRQKYGDFIQGVENTLQEAELNFSFAEISSWVAKGLTRNKPRAKNKIWNEETLNKVIAGNFGKGEHEALFRQQLRNELEERASSWDEVTAEIMAETVSNTFDEMGFPPVSAEMLVLASIGETVEGELTKFQKAMSSRSIAWSGDRAIPLSEVSDQYFLHQAISRAAYLCGLESKDGKPLNAKDVINALMAGQTYNAASWLLGVGLDAMKEATPEEIQDEFGCPEEKAKELLSLYKDFIARVGTAKASQYRTHLGGSITSFVEVYWQRLAEINYYLNALKPVLEEELPAGLFSGSPVGERIFWGVPCTASQLKRMWEDLRGAVSDAADAAGALLRGQSLVGADGLKVIKTSIEMVCDLGSTLNRIVNNRDMMLRDADAAASSDLKKEMMDYLSTVNFSERLLNSLDRQGGGDDFERVGKKGPFNPPAMNEIGRERLFTEQTYEQASSRFGEMISWFGKYVSSLGDLSRPASTAIAGVKHNEKRHREQRGQSISDEALEILARRFLLNNWFSGWRNLSEEARLYGHGKLKRAGYIFRDRKERVTWAKLSRDFMFERKGVFYKGMYARGRHKPISLNESRLAGFEFDRLINEMVGWAEARKNESADALLDYVRVLVMRSSLIAKGLTGDQPSSKIDPRLSAPDWFELTLYHSDEAILNSEDALSSDLARKVISRVGVEVREMGAFLGANSSLEVYSFKPTSDAKRLTLEVPVEDNEGEDVYWAVPNRITKGASLASQGWSAVSKNLDADGIEISEARGVRTKDILAAIKGKLKDPGIKALLSEMPHKWGWSVASPWLSCSEDQIPKGSVFFGVEKSNVMRIGVPTLYSRFEAPAKHVQMLDKILLGKAENGAGAIVAKLHYTRSEEGFGNPESHIYLHQPIKTFIEDVKPDSAYFDRMIAIDLGERGIGYSVRSVEPESFGDLIEKGFVRIPAIKKLIKTSEAYRKKHVRQLKNGRRSPVNLAKMRTSVAGSVFSAIKNLMAIHKAFPVLEDNIGNLDKGAKQLSHVYTEVQSYFVYNDAQTLNAQREHKWRGGYVPHPYLVSKTKTESKKDEEKKPLNLFPGVKVFASGSSQECSCCGRNASKTIRNMKKSQFEVNAEGRVELSDGWIALRTIQLKDGKRNFFPYGARRISKDDLLTAVKLQRRLKPSSAQSKDTTQSVYVCLYSDCEFHTQEVHADVNAADVLVLRKINSVELA